jgi:putative endonuclease
MAPRPVRDRAAAERAGRRAETIAAWWLRFHGWSILAMRARVRGGEIDIVARRLRRVFAAAETLFHRYRRPGDDMRVDAIFIVPGKWPRHLVNLWRD